MDISANEILLKGNGYTCQHCFYLLLKMDLLQKARIFSPWEQILFFQISPSSEKAWCVGNQKERKWWKIFQVYPVPLNKIKD